ncbi:MAG: HlyD family efflux transporter periplasmic adaptor subunit [Burkholderiales bacterium]|jgi:RND family efflux transporter MFP subunit|nr:HlyD family efflux transporter periplasmic adaptor subunit [Burkholderiales bacterium]
MPASAPVYSIAEEHRVRAESAEWSRFTAPNDSAEFCGAWLALLCTHVGRARAALVLTGEEGEGAFTVAAAWPDGQRDLQYLGPTAQLALTERRGVVMGADGAPPSHDSAAQVAYPVEVDGRLFGAVVLDVGAGALADLQGALRQVHWASAWLVDHFRQRLLQRREAELARVAALNELMATALQFGALQPSALAVANELARRLRCDRVSIGFEQGGQVVPLVLSHTAAFDKRSDLVRTLGEVMDEVLDLGVAVAHPGADGEELGALAHVEAARALHMEAMLSVPLLHEGATTGVITLERHAATPFDAAEQRLLRALGVTLGPVWALQRANERNGWQRLSDASHAALQATVGPRHPGLKLIGVVLTAALLIVTLVQVDHRVVARTAIEGATQLAAVAPFEGYLAAGLVRAGDTVKRGQPLAQLDDRDLKLERARWASEREQAARKYQVAMAGADRSAMAVLSAQVNQAEAQLALAEEKLARATLVAPFAGIVVSGDLSQLIGTPVEQGKLLFEIAPLSDYRVVLQVDDRDMAHLAKAQRGELVLSSLPDLNLPITVTAITPVATQRDGRNVFRVEARIDSADAARLRPGMEGVGKVVVGQRSLLWIWTHGFTEWLRLTLWNWVP